MTKKRRVRFPVNARVIDDEGEIGVVVHVPRDPALADCRAVRFGRLGDNAVMVPLDTLKRYRTAPISKRRRGK
jgi:hypothetical protein